MVWWSMKTRVRVAALSATRNIVTKWKPNHALICQRVNKQMVWLQMKMIVNVVQDHVMRYPGSFVTRADVPGDQSVVRGIVNMGKHVSTARVKRCLYAPTRMVKLKMYNVDVAPTYAVPTNIVFRKGTNVPRINHA
tara:strand:+ start:1224 stop:1631 length:408 start_codon:yes stop_codon:yes gene_type:complete